MPDGIEEWAMNQIFDFLYFVNKRKVFEGHRKEVGMRLDAWTVYFED